MPRGKAEAITATLKAAAEGDSSAAAELLPLVYEELRSLARSRMARLAAGQTLQPTALVHEAYVRVVGEVDPSWDSRGHFFAAAARAMRDILVEQARRKASLKRGGDRVRADLRDSELAIAAPTTDVLGLNEALSELETDDPRKGQIVNMRYFAGLTIEETAAALGISVGTVKREWQFAKRWLFTRLNPQDNEQERGGGLRIK